MTVVVYKCEVCLENQFKYKCSKCLLKYCSIPCLNKHKEQDKCTNRLYDPLEYVSNKEIKSLDDEDKSNNLVVKRDYEYLMGMDRVISVSRSDFSLKNKYISSYANNNIHNNRTVNKFLTENGMELRFIMQRGCRCFLLPVGSSVHKRNKSRYDNKLKKFQWTLNWNIQTDALNKSNEPHQFTLDKCFEDLKLIDLISKKWSQEEFKTTFGIETSENENLLTLQFKQDLVLNYVSKNKIQVFLKYYPNKMNNLLDTRNAILVKDLEIITLAELLTGQTCMEFPTIYVKVLNNDSITVDSNSLYKEESFYKQKLFVYKSVEDIKEPEIEAFETIIPEISENELDAREIPPTLQSVGALEDQDSINQPVISAKRVIQQTEHSSRSENNKKIKLSITAQNINKHLPKSIPDLFENTDSDSDDVAEDVEAEKHQTASNSLAAKLFG
ncbi:hypothetical protein QEN19_001591 [Hanseniaspora menglaensis]